MRRKDRQVSAASAAIDIINACKVCRIAMIDGDCPYVVPMNFGYEWRDDQLTLFFHCATQGRKIDVLRRCPSVCIEMDTAHRLLEADTACRYAYGYASVIGEGVVRFIEPMDLKRQALSRIMQHQTGRDDWYFEEKSVRAVTVFSVAVLTWSAKRRD